MRRHSASRTALAAVSALMMAGSAAAQEKVIRVAHIGFNPQRGQAHMAFGAQSALPLMVFMDSMMYVGDKGELEPGLATTWRSIDKDTWEVKLRPGVKFHNDRTLDAAALVKGIEQHINHEDMKTSVVTNFLQFASARAVDAMTVEIKTKQPNPIFDRWLVLLRPHEPAYFEEVGNKGFTNLPIGTGPFKVTNWSDSRMEATAYRGGWRPPKVDRIVIESLTETATRVQALQSGQIQIAWSLAADDIEKLKVSGQQVVVTPGDDVVAVKFTNLANRSEADIKPLLDTRVRQALNYGVNREEFVKNVLRGLTVPAGQGGPRSAYGYQPDLTPYPYDPERAKRLLSDAGYASGLKIKIELLPTNTEYTDTGQFIASDLKKIGVDIELRQTALADFLSKFRGQKPFEGQGWIGVTENYPTLDLMRGYSSDSCSFFGKYQCDERIQPTINAANVEFDPKKRMELMRAALKHYRDEALFMYMFERFQIDGLARNVRNYKLHNRTVNWHALELG
ncbi:MAG: ABC transporter substrate-binding protein [Alphaproteobacteria bacterium]|nr:ABC transporter substrate-binding protein [Alphaproteobacteria bacterium]